MAILVRIAGDAYERFWTSIDLPANFTPEDLAAGCNVLLNVMLERASVADGPGTGA